MSQSPCQKTLSELIRSRGRPISKSPVVSEGVLVRLLAVPKRF